MLAYVFWHWRSESVERARYEGLVTAFHASLERDRPPGLIRSAAFALDRAPWMAADGYEEWYLVTDSAALDPLNDDVMKPPHRQPHDEVAHAAGGGTAGLYRLRAGEADWPSVASAHWFAKPAGMRYDELDALLAPLSRKGAAVWMRQMVLGPTTEFCLHADVKKPISIPEPLAPLSIPLRRVWPR